jgi:hypothetical protein
MSWVGTVREASSTNPNDRPTPTTYPDPRHAKAVPSIILPIPAAERHMHLTGDIFVVGPNARGVPFGGYLFDFRYDKLPTNIWHRIPGNNCGHDTSSTSN